MFMLVGRCLGGDRDERWLHVLSCARCYVQPRVMLTLVVRSMRSMPCVALRVLWSFEGKCCAGCATNCSSWLADV